MSLRRLEQRRGRGENKQPGLNLVSLMDIFTILVFFLMVNANEVEVLEVSSAIKLPDSVSEDAPEDRVTIEINQDDLLFQGKPIASVSNIMQEADTNIAPLFGALQTLALSDADNRKVTIMGDQALPYALLKRVMVTCQSASFTHIALAVNQVGNGGEST